MTEWKERLAKSLGIDLSGLLGLAEEMTWCYEGAAGADGDGTVGAWVVMEYADRIRELCGEVDA